MKKADELGLPLDLVQHFIGADEDSTNSNLENFHSAFQTAIKTQVDSKFKQNGRDVKNYGDNKQEISSIADLANEFNIRNK